VAVVVVPAVVVMTVVVVMMAVVVVHAVTAAVHHHPAAAATTVVAAAAVTAAGFRTRGDERRQADNDRCGKGKDCSALEHFRGSFCSAGAHPRAVPCCRSGPHWRLCWPSQDCRIRSRTGGDLANYQQEQENFPAKLPKGAHATARRFSCRTPPRA
jgi:hypothetical protein